jgi:hypothetical protein
MVVFDRPNHIVRRVDQERLLLGALAGVVVSEPPSATYLVHPALREPRLPSLVSHLLGAFRSP